MNSEANCFFYSGVESFAEGWGSGSVTQLQPKIQNLESKSIR